MVQGQQSKSDSTRIQAARLRLSTWTTAAKQGLGTAFYEGDGTDCRSHVWYTLAAGALSEVYYPDIARPALRQLQLAVSDGENFFDLETTDTEHSVDLACDDALVYRQVNTGRDGLYTISKTYAVDPDHEALIIQFTVRVDGRRVNDLQWYIVHHPAAGGALADNTGRQFTVHGRTVATVSRQSVAVALACDADWQVRHLSETMLPNSHGELAGLFAPTTLEVGETEQTHVQLAKLDMHEAGDACECSFVLSVGFGATRETAMKAAGATRESGFEKVTRAYCDGWAPFVARLHVPQAGDARQFRVAAMTVKAHEDKQFPGAVAASLSIPWGDSVSAWELGTGGYHLIWARDLYQAASGLAIAGDPSLAYRALRYLQDVQQREDGSFPQNTWPDGSPYWSGLQLCQTALPILLAYLVDQDGQFDLLVRRAADFLVYHGPHSQQERWEENSGYSPSTLAAVVAGLAAASVLARRQGDYGAAAVYLATADQLADAVQAWTVAPSGPLSEKPYYIRVSNTMNPADGAFVEVKNGGGWHPKIEIVDGGFLELVRLGVVAPDDAIIVNSLNVIDREIYWDGAGVPLWYRYNHDGYGEASDGAPYNGVGRGRPWPMLSGERGEYEVALAASPRQNTPDRLFGAAELLRTMAVTAGPGGMIAEQVWDGEDDPVRGLFRGCGTGSATPLAWAMAQYLRLAVAVDSGRNLDTPTFVHSRYVDKQRPAGPQVRLDLPESLVTLAVSSSRVTLSGRSDPGATVALVSSGCYYTTRCDDAGRFRCTLHLFLAGDNDIRVIGYDNEGGVSESTVVISYRPRRLYSARSVNLSTRAGGLFQYPTHPDFKTGDFSLEGMTLSADEEAVYFEIELGHLDNPWGGPTGISKQIIDIYLRDPARDDEGQDWTKDLGARFQPGNGWHKLIRVSGNWHGETQVYNSDWSYAGPVRLAPHYQARTVAVAVPQAVLGGCPGSGWGIMIVVAGEAGGKARPVRAQASEWTFGGGREDGTTSYILDFLVTPDAGGMSHEDPGKLLSMNFIP